MGKPWVWGLLAGGGALVLVGAGVGVYLLIRAVPTPPPVNTTCTLDSECKPEEACYRGTCRARVGLCKADTDCTVEGQFCVGSTSGAWGACSSGCSTFANCKPKICGADGRCKLCTATSECPSGLSCLVDGTCAACTSSSQCRDGLACIGASCVTPPPQCTIPNEFCPGSGDLSICQSDLSCLRLPVGGVDPSNMCLSSPTSNAMKTLQMFARAAYQNRTWVPDTPAGFLEFESLKITTLDALNETMPATIYAASITAIYNTSWLLSPTAHYTVINGCPLTEDDMVVLRFTTQPASTSFNYCFIRWVSDGAIQLSSLNPNFAATPIFTGKTWHAQ